MADGSSVQGPVSYAEPQYFGRDNTFPFLVFTSSMRSICGKG